MAEKHTTLEELARAEATALKQREQAKLDYIAGQERLCAEMPELFFALAKQIREGTRRFNGAAGIQRPVQYQESPAVTIRLLEPGAELHVSIARTPNECTLALRTMTRTGGSDSFLIEGFGTLGVPPTHERFSLRVDGIVRGREIAYRTTIDGQKVDSEIDELGDRLVMMIVTGQLARLWNTPPWA